MSVSCCRNQLWIHACVWEMVGSAGAAQRKEDGGFLHGLAVRWCSETNGRTKGDHIESRGGEGWRVAGEDGSNLPTTLSNTFRVNLNINAKRKGVIFKKENN